MPYNYRDYPNFKREAWADHEGTQFVFNFTIKCVCGMFVELDIFAMILSS